MVYDILIIGGGPAGVSAALYTKRSNIKTLVISMNQGNLHKAELIENYYGIDSPTTGGELFEIGHNQVRALDVPIKKEQVLNLDYDGSRYRVTTDVGEYFAKAVILATGVSRLTPKIKNIRDFEGKGVSYCAICDAFFYRNKNVGVIGCGEYALHEAKELSMVANTVTIYTNGVKPEFKAPKGILVDTRVITEVLGDEQVKAIKFSDGEEVNIDGLFIALGIASSTSFARTIGAQTEGNKMIVNDLMMTNVPGLFACGDATGGLLQIAKAVYEGAVAGLEAVKYVRLNA